MSDHCEEQEMEAEALAAIFDTAFETISDTQPFQWSVKLVPVDCGGDEEEENRENHVAVKLLCTIPMDYPESLPTLDLEILKGLAEEQRQEILEIGRSEAEANEGMPLIFAVCEAVRSWLADNNVKGLDDASMHAQMMRRAKEAERSKAKKEIEFESQKKEEKESEAELEEQAVRKRREEGTPCTEASFMAWKEKFDVEMEQEAAEAALAASEASGGGKNKQTKKMEETNGRLTGFEQFSGTAGILSLEAIEAAAEEAENNADAIDVDEIDVDEDLFDDDEDLDDLDFDDDDDDDDDEDIDI